MKAAVSDEFSLRDAIGGPRGFIESLLPTLVFIVVFTWRHNLGEALTYSLGAAGVLIVARIVTRQRVTPAISGAVAVGIAAIFAQRTGEARNYFLPGLITNFAYSGALLMSVVRFPRFSLSGEQFTAGPWPIPGLMLGAFLNEGIRWRDFAPRRRAYVRITWLWIALFSARLIVQAPLYLTDQIGALGAARIAMGVPLFALTVFASWSILRHVPPTPEPHDDESSDSSDGSDESGVGV